MKYLTHNYFKKVPILITILMMVLLCGISSLIFPKEVLGETKAVELGIPRYLIIDAGESGDGKVDSSGNQRYSTNSPISDSLSSTLENIGNDPGVDTPPPPPPDPSPNPIPVTPQKDTKSSNKVYRLLAPIPGLECIDPENTDKNCVKGNIGTYLNTIFKIAIGLCGVLAVIMLVINFIGYMASESFTEKAKFKSKFWGPIGGLLLALGAYAILVTINPALTGKEGLTVDQVGVTVEDQLALSYSGLDYTIYTKGPKAIATMPTGEELEQIRARYVNATKYVKSDYIPTLLRVLPNISKGAKTLMTAQTTIEGFKPGTRSYDNHNPGNLGTDETKTGKYDTLELGIKAQYNHLTKVASGKYYLYPVGQRVNQKGVTSKKGTYYPPIDFNPYTGALSQYLNIYDAGTRTSNVYMNFVISFFAKEGMNISPSTTIQDIYKM